MNQPFQTTHSCLPVTALQTLRLTHNLLLFSAQGPFLSVIDVASGETLSCQRVFASSTIHGVACDYSASHTRARTLLIWGASSICFARLNFDEHRLLPFRPYSGPGQTLIIRGLEIGETINVPDRILDASFACDASSADVQACLVTAHNELLLLRFGRSRLSLRLGTDLLHVSPTISRISTGEEPLLYSARVQSLRPGTFQVVAGTAFGKILVWFTPASFNHGDTHKLVEVGTGHKGATFGVDQFDEWLASCSDDRGIRIGVDLSELFIPHPPDTNNTQPVLLNNGCREMVERWRHTSRAWGVKFITIATDVLGLVSIGEDAFCQIWQIGRKGLMQLVNDRYHSGKHIWAVAEGHLGGHQVITGGADGAIMSRSVSTRPLSGGVDASTAAQPLPKVAGSRFDHYQSSFVPPFSELGIDPAAKRGSEVKPSSIKQYVFVSSSCLFALTDSGSLLRILQEETTSTDDHLIDSYDNSTGAYALPMSLKWFTVNHGNIFNSRPVLSNSEDHLAFLGTGDGNLFLLLPANEGTVTFVAALNMSISWLTIAASTDVSGLSTMKISSTTLLTRVYCVVAFCEGTKTAKAVWIQLCRDVEGRVHLNSSEEAGQDVPSPPWEIDAKGYSIDLPETFTPKSARVLNSTGALVLGSRQSAIAIYKPLDNMENSYLSPHCYRHVHGDDTVTSISCIQTTEYPEDIDFFLTTGRNGTYAVHSVQLLVSHSEFLSLNETTLVFETLDCSTSLFSSGIEGSYCAQGPGPIFKSSKEFPPLGEPRVDFWFRHFEGSGRSKSGDLILYGFNAKKFVVWNESHQSLVFSTDCGNEHRPWAYNTYTPAVPAGKLNLPHHGPFAWTQAGSFNIVSIGQPDHFTIQQGGHGREIKALAVSPLPCRSLCHGIRNGILIATGAEDTAIRFFVIGASKETHARNKMICLRTEKKHTTGLQRLSFSSCGSYLFSSGGCEELYAWRIRLGVPGVNLGVLLDCTFPKETGKSDLRITDLSVRSRGSGYFVVSAVYSNSMIKFFRYTTGMPSSKSTCELLHRFFYQDNCLTQINDCAESGILTASTDGHLALWSVPGERYWPLAFCELPAGGESGLEPHRHRVHQSSVKVMFTVNLPSKSGQKDQIVITGGDDNALGLTLMRTHTSGGDATPSRPITSFQTLLIPKAHAAAITAMCLCSLSFSLSQEFHIRFLSMGNDQRVKLWSVSVYIERMGLLRGNSGVGGDAMSALDVHLLANMETTVADVGAMEVLPEQQIESNGVHDPETKPPLLEGQEVVRVLVVGVGMEVLQFML